MYKESFSSSLLQEAVDQFSSLPGVGKKNALRLALHLLRLPVENVNALGNALINLRKGALYCKECNMVSDTEICDICADSKRDHSIICVVESLRDVLSIESTGEYNGVYFVLGGLISPMDGIGPDDLPIARLVSKIENSKVEEVVLALSTGMEGETTSFYLCKVFGNLNVKISSIARGVGFGDDLEYTDRLTLGRAIAGRVLIQNNNL